MKKYSCYLLFITKTIAGLVSLRPVNLVMVSLLTIALSPGVASADHPANFSNKRIKIIVPYKEGGASDTFSRTFARVLGKHLPGKPNVIVQNIPGAGAISGTNRFEREARPDGLTLLVTSTSTLLNYVTGAKGVKYSPSQWIPLIVAPQGAVSYVRSETGVTADMPIAERIKQVKDFGVVYGDSSPTGGPLRFLLSLDLLGIHPKTVWGLSGGGPRRQGFQRNEFQINYESSNSYIKRGIPMVKEGIAMPFFSMGMVDSSGKIAADPLFPEIPTLLDGYKALNKGAEPEGLAWEAWRKLFIIGTFFNKALFLPQDTPDNIIEAYVTAVEASVADPDFLKNGGKNLIKYNPTIGPKAAPLLADAVDLPDEVFDYLNTFLSTNHDVTISR